VENISTLNGGRKEGNNCVMREEVGGVVRGKRYDGSGALRGGNNSHVGDNKCVGRIIYLGHMNFGRMKGFYL